VKQFEGGVKYAGEWLELYTTAFYNENDAFASTVGGVLPPTAFATEAYGVELDRSFNLAGVLETFIGTFQSTESTDSTTASDCRQRSPAAARLAGADLAVVYT
jgi:hypothetical protein